MRFSLLPVVFILLSACTDDISGAPIIPPTSLDATSQPRDTEAIQHDPRVPTGVKQPSNNSKPTGPSGGTGNHAPGTGCRVVTREEASELDARAPAGVKQPTQPPKGGVQPCRP